MHDATVKRTTNGGDVAVSSLTFAQLEKLDAGSWFGAQFVNTRVPSFEELLVYLKTGAPDYFIVMDIKVTGIAQQIADVVQKHDMGNRVIASCWSDASAANAQEFLINGTRIQNLGKYPSDSPDFGAYIDAKQALGYESFSLQYQSLPSGFIQRAAQRQMTTFLWTIDDEAALKAADNAFGIITNVPRTAKGLLNNETRATLRRAIQR